MKRKPHSRKTAQRGITLVESLISLLILALGVLGLAAVQARMLVETRTTNARATAVRLIADLGERIRMNAAGAQPPISGGDSPYTTKEVDFKAPGDTAPDNGACAPAGIIQPTDTNACTDGTFCDPPESGAGGGSANNPPACTPALQAAYDMWAWRREIQKSLMGGLASVTQVGNSPQLRVMVAWRLNENTNATLTGTASDQKLAAPLQVTSAAVSATGGTSTATDLCADAFHICHVDFIDIPPHVKPRS